MHVDASGQSLGTPPPPPPFLTIRFPGSQAHPSLRIPMHEDASIQIIGESKGISALHSSTRYSLAMLHVLASRSKLLRAEVVAPWGEHVGPAFPNFHCIRDNILCRPM